MLNCRLCTSLNINSVIDFGQQPIVHNLLQNKDELYEQYSFNLGYCSACGFLQLIDFIKPELLYTTYFTISAWKIQPHVQSLIDHIEYIYHPNHKTKILEIGCNDGTFITSLNKRGYNNILGIEPTLNSYLISKHKGHNVLNKFFNTDLVDGELTNEKEFDLVITRQVLEHIANLDDFLTSIRCVLKINGGLIIEIPDHSMNLEMMDYSLWEEHVNYFTKNTLHNLLKIHGFNILHYDTTLFSGKTLICYAIKCDTSNKTVINKDDTLVMNYINKMPVLRDKIRIHLGNESKNKKLFVYGCGARSSTLVNFFNFHEFLESYIDDQKEKQGLYVPGSLLKINPFSQDYLNNSTFLFGVNTENEQRVINSKNLSDSDVDIYSILPPSRLLPKYWVNLVNQF